MWLAAIFAAGSVRHMSVRAGGRTATGTDSVRACGLSLEDKGQVYELPYWVPQGVAQVTARPCGGHRGMGG